MATKRKSAAKGKASPKGKTRAKAKSLSPKQAGKVKGGLIGATSYTSGITRTAISPTALPTKLYE